MNILFKLILDILMVLKKIGDTVRLLFSLLLKTYISSNSKSKLKKNKSVKKTYSQPKPPFNNKLIQIKSLPSLYWQSICSAIIFLFPFIHFKFLGRVFHCIYIEIKYITAKINYTIFDMTKKITPKPTPDNPMTIYPVPLHVAWRIQSFFAGILITILFIFLPFAISTWVKSLPNPKLLSGRDLQVSTKIYDRNGKLLYDVYSDQDRTPMPLSDIPEIMQKATIAIEDKNFYLHQGFSITGILRALKINLVDHQVQGGSTITQQLVKSALLTPEISITRKVKELVLAFWAEQIYSKNQILEMYLNQVPYGGTAWGVESASLTYFNKSVKDLSLAQAALLAGLPAAPSQYSPFGSSPQLAISRQHEVLKRMLEDKDISQAQYNQAILEKISYATPHIGIRAPHFVMYVKDILEKRYGTRMVEQGGLRVTTTLDADIQSLAETVVKSQLATLTYLKVGNGAVMVTNPKTGEILAMIGSKDYFDLANDGNVNVTTSLRQPGSSIKVVNYAAALENGFTAASIIDDSPVVFQSLGSPPYAPVNYDGRFHGPTPLRYALGNSYNIPAVKVLAKIGVKTMIDKAKLMGINSWMDESQYGLSLTLGGGDVTMLEMAKVYGTLANSGKKIDLMPILRVTDYTGKIIDEFKPDRGTQAVTPEISWIISNILSDNNARTTAFGPNSSLIIPGKTVSVKTGTSNDKRDNWTIGYTPSVVTTVWVGNNDNSPMDPQLTSGITGAAPIWHDIMAELLKNRAEDVLAKPDNIIGIPCYFGRIEYFIKGTQPTSGQCGAIPIWPTPTPK